MSRPSQCRLFERASSNTFRVIHEKPPARGPGFHPVSRIPALLDTGCRPVDWLVYQASATAVATRHSVHEWLSGDRGLLTLGVDCRGVDCRWLPGRRLAVLALLCSRLDTGPGPVDWLVYSGEHRRARQLSTWTRGEEDG